MPINSIGGIWSADLWNPKYVSYFFPEMLPLIFWQQYMDLPFGPPGHLLMF